MRWLTRWRVVVSLGLVLALAGSAWAEYCQSQGSPALPRNQVGRFNWRAFLDSAEIVASEVEHLPWGRPSCDHYLFHREYVVCYDRDRRVARWASYRIERKHVKAGNRINAFRSDPRLPEVQNPACEDYRGSGFDRGHLVPRSDMARTKTASLNTFFLTNMMPQLPNVNQGAWARLEDLVRVWAKKFGFVHVVSGSVFDWDDNRQPDTATTRLTESGSAIGVPSHFYKILLHQTTGGEWETITFILPNDSQVPGRSTSNATRDTYLGGRLTSIQDIRLRSGLDLLPDFPAAANAVLEQAVASEMWPKN